jgi:adenylate cyclase
MVRSFEIFEANVLVVDDQEANVLLFERMLRAAGYSSVQSTMDPREV